MEIKDVFEAGGDILNAVADAVNRNDFTGLSDNVRDTVSRTVGRFQEENLNRFNGNPEGGRYREPNAQYQNQSAKYQYSQGAYQSRSDTGGVQDHTGGGTYGSTQSVDSGQNSRYDGTQSTYRGQNNRYSGVQSPYRSQNTQYGGAQSPYRSQDNQYDRAQSTDVSAYGQFRNLPATITNSPAGRVSGPLQLGGGILATALFGAAALVLGILFGVKGGLVLGILTACFGGLTAYGISHIVRGSHKIGLVKKFYQYARLIGPKSYIAIEDIASQTNQPKEDVLKNLRRMTRKRMFPQGRFDEKETTFMLTKEVYDQYQILEKTQREREEEERRAKEEEERRAEELRQNGSYNEETRRILEEGNEYIRMVHRCNEDIPGEAMSDKLDRLEQIMRKIFEQVKRHPESAENLHKFMTYYLPTTKKLLDAYIDLDRQEISGENIVNTKREIEETLDTINTAFERLLDGMFEDTAWDISTDISVMKTMMAQEGLTGGNDFKEL